MAAAVSAVAAEAAAVAKEAVVLEEAQEELREHVGEEEQEA